MGKHLHVDIGPEIIPLVIERRIVVLHIVDGEQSVFVVDRSRNIIFGDTTAAADAQIDLLVPGMVFIKLAEPVHIRVEVGIGTVPIAFDGLVGEEFSAVGFVIHPRELHRIQHLGDFHR